MPTTLEHLSKAEQNSAFAKSLPLTDTAHVEWALVALFYASVHFIEAYLVKQGTPSSSHGDRTRMIRSDQHLRHIFREYSDLKTFGWQARYDVPSYTRLDVIDDAIPALDAIKAHIHIII